LQALLNRLIFGAFLLNVLIVLARVLTPGLNAGRSWGPEATLLILGVATALGPLLRELPAQNVALVVVTIAALSLGADVFSAVFSVPVPHSQSVVMLVWWMPLVRVFAILNSRGVARFILAPRRQTPNYGLWVLGVTVLLTVLFALNLAACPPSLSGYSAFSPAVKPQGGYGLSWPAVAIWAVTVFVIAVVIVPLLLNKRPNAIATNAREASPFWVWLCTNLVFLAVAIRHGVWLPTGIIALEVVVVSALVAKPHWERSRDAGRSYSPSGGDGSEAKFTV